jgi:hypothetical protein
VALYSDMKGGTTVVRLGIGALVVAGILGYMTYVEGTMALQSSATPETISLKKLIARGPDGNAHIIITDFALCENLVNQANERSKDVWTQVWIPVVPIDEVDPDARIPVTPRNVKALVFSTNVRNAIEVETRLAKPSIQGMVTNRISSLETKIRALLQQSYPDTDFDKCLIIQEGRAPFSVGLVFLTGAGAVLALLVAVALFLGAWLRRA